MRPTSVVGWQCNLKLLFGEVARGGGGLWCDGLAAS
jgi:hypothetical protein